MTDVTFDSLGLPEGVLKALHETGYTVPTPIQAQSIPALLKGNDLLGLAETGSGKTAAFALPLLSMLASNGAPRLPKSTRALILAPTRELAIQIGDSMREYGKHLGLKYALIFGGVGISPQVRTMQMGVDVLVATPGRLLDLMHQRAVKLDHVTHFVLDEADRMLDMGFIHDVRKIVAALPKVRQSLLFSATMPEDISSLAAKLLRDPVRVEVARAGTPVDRIDQKVYFVETPQKRAALATLLKDPAFERVIVFTRTKRGADRVARGLEAVGIGSHAIHGNKSQNARQGALARFRDGSARVLVATDIAARGIDIDGISHVVNYDIPNIPESYVHRIGRTARAGATGVAISLCAGDEKGYLRDIERLMSRKVADAGQIEGLAEVAASLPAVKHRADADESATEHFERSRGRVQSRRFLPRTLEKDTWREGQPPRTETAGEQRDRRPQRDDRGGDRPFRPREERGEKRFGDRDRPRGDRPWQNRGDRDDRPRDDRPHGDRAHSGERRPFARRDGESRPPRSENELRPPRTDYTPRPPRDGDAERPFDRNRERPWLKRGPGGEGRPPRGESDSRPPRGESDSRPPRGESDSRPPRGEHDSRPPRRDYAPRPPREGGDRGPYRGPRGEGRGFEGRGDRGPRSESRGPDTRGERPRHGDFRPRDGEARRERPANDRSWRKDGGPNRDRGGERPQGRGGDDRGERRPYSGPRGDFKGRGDRPGRDRAEAGPRREHGGGDRGPRRDFGDRGPRGGDGDNRARDGYRGRKDRSGGPRGDAPKSGNSES